MDGNDRAAYVTNLCPAFAVIAWFFAVLWCPMLQTFITAWEELPDDDDAAFPVACSAVDTDGVNGVWPASLASPVGLARMEIHEPEYL